MNDGNLAYLRRLDGKLDALLALTPWKRKCFR
jgi:hypothetical protein